MYGLLSLAWSLKVFWAHSYAPECHKHILKQQYFKWTIKKQKLQDLNHFKQFQWTQVNSDREHMTLLNDVRNKTQCQLTLHAVVFLVVEAEVVSQLPAHHQLLDVGGDGHTCLLPAVLNLQGHPLCWQVAWWDRRWDERQTKMDRMRWRW